jgi:zinc protease
MMGFVRRAGAGVKCISIIALLGAAALLASCGKSAEETDESRGDQTAAQTPADEGPGELAHYRLDNGINVYLREDHSGPEVAVEALYPAGVIHENMGKVHVSRVLPHMLLFSATASYGPNEAVRELGAKGSVNAEVYGELVRFNYTAPSDQIETVFKVESERITTVRFSTDQLETYTDKCARDVDEILDSPQLSIFKYGLMAFNQAYNYGMTYVPIYQGLDDVSLADLENFRQRRYRLADMVLVVTGDFDTAATIELVKKYFGGIEEKPKTTAEPPHRPDGDLDAHWDVDRNVMFLVYPGPYENEEERLALTMFGTYLTRYFRNDMELAKDIQSSLCSSSLHPVGDVPFFVFVELKRGRVPREILPALLAVVEKASREMNEQTFKIMKTNLIEFYKSSVLDSQRTIRSLTHNKALAQEAFDIGKKHYLRNGSTTEAFVEKIRSITYEDARHYVDSRLSEQNMKEISLQKS